MTGIHILNPSIVETQYMVFCSKCTGCNTSILLTLEYWKFHFNSTTAVPLGLGMPFKSLGWESIK